jgi:hypothetical protein
MSSIAQDLRDILQLHGHLEYVSMKTASEEATYIGQVHVAKIANAVTEYVQHAGGNDVVTFISKLAEDLSHPLDAVSKLKVAAAMTVDQVLTKAAQDVELSAHERDELLSTRTYGREVFAEILRGVL